MKINLNKKTVWITSTAVLIALLIGMQVFTAQFGQFVTGSLVNLILIISVMTCGPASGLTVAVFSPFFAKLLGIGPLWTIVPFIAIGNVVLVLVWHFLGNMRFANVHIVRVIALIAAAVCKFLTLYIGVARITVPLFLNLPEPQAAAISSIFALPQLITASIGGALALVIIPVLTRSSTARPSGIRGQEKDFK